MVHRLIFSFLYVVQNDAGPKVHGSAVPLRSCLRLCFTVGQAFAVVLGIVVSVATYGCSSSAGLGVKAFFKGLIEGTDHSRNLRSFDDTKTWPQLPDADPRLCRFKDLIAESYQERIIRNLRAAWVESWKDFSPASYGSLTSNMGVIFASTKGSIDDFIWDPQSPAHSSDPVTPLLREFLKRIEVNPKRYVCVNNACTSSHAALFLAKHWLETDQVSSVAVIAAESVGPFTVNGFSSLQALSRDVVKPFDRTRSGLQLGEAAAVMVLSKKNISNKIPCIQLQAVTLHTEGYAITRSSPNGEGLRKALQNIPDLLESPPDLIIAHATGTSMNDKVEDQAFCRFFSSPPPTTCTKWSIGHSLGSSGAMDVIAACEVLKTAQVFSIGNTTEIDPDFKGKYLIKGHSDLSSTPNKILVSSVGFGGVHGAVVLANWGKAA